MSENAVALLTQACRDKYPDSTVPEPREAPLVALAPEARELLNGKFGYIAGNTWSGTIYNGNEDWQVEEVYVLLYKPGWIEHLVDSKKGEYPMERYRVAVKVLPLSASSFSIEVNWPPTDEFEWMFGPVRGRRITTN